MVRRRAIKQTGSDTRARLPSPPRDGYGSLRAAWPYPPRPRGESKVETTPRPHGKGLPQHLRQGRTAWLSETRIALRAFVSGPETATAQARRRADTRTRSGRCPPRGAQGRRGCAGNHDRRRSRHGDRRTASFEGAPVCLAVDPAGETAYDDDACPGVAYSGIAQMAKQPTVTSFFRVPIHRAWPK